ncbi:lysozyme-like protein 5 [Ditylenchus destructor]|nr:lysozyme-like protein 5 [Ditylenchus destructor]
MSQSFGKHFLLYLCLFAIQTSNVLAGSIGIDSDVVISKEKFQTTLAAGYTFFLGQYFDGGIVSDPNTILGIASGVNGDAGYSQLVDAIHIPVYTESAPLDYPFVGRKTNVYSQARVPIDLLNFSGGFIGRTWVVVSQSAGSRWSSNQASNRAFLTEFLSYFPNPLGPQVGILTDQTDFQAIFGSSYSPVDQSGAAVQLWWQNCNEKQDYTGFTPFNGWNTPVMHQYQCNVSNIANQSGVNGNINWFA